MSNTGYFLHKTKPEAIKEAVWLEEQCLRRQGGYDLDRDNLPATLKWLPKGTVLKFDKASGKAVAVKTAKVTEKAEKAATTLKVVSGSLFKVGDVIGGLTITKIESDASTGIDTLTGTGGVTNGAAKDEVVTDYEKSKDVLIGFSYDTLDLRDPEASLAATPTLQVMEVEEDSLPYPINDDIKAGISANGIALFKIQ